MTQQANAFPEVNAYMQHQAEKGIESLVALMQRTAADWQRNVGDMSEPQAAFAPAGEWSALQVANHFLEVTRGANQQIARLTRTGALPKGSLDEETLAEQGGKAECQSVAEMSAWLAELFDDVVSLTRALDGNRHLEERFPHPMFGQLNILEWIAFQRVHSVDHMRQIDGNKADSGYPA